MFASSPPSRSLPYGQLFVSQGCKVSKSHYGILLCCCRSSPCCSIAPAGGMSVFKGRPLAGVSSPADVMGDIIHNLKGLQISLPTESITSKLSQLFFSQSVEFPVGHGQDVHDPGPLAAAATGV